jgi:hypothetical protein
MMLRRFMVFLTIDVLHAHKGNARMHDAIVCNAREFTSVTKWGEEQGMA